MLTLVIGGAASGKSDFAEALVLATGLTPVYIATAQAWDDEMRAKIARHQTTRQNQGWRTVEAPTDLSTPLACLTTGNAALIDCATMWLTNHLLAEHDLSQAEAELMQALTACPAPVTIVSNEVGAGIVPENALARRFRDAQGGVNRRLAARADRVVTVMAGLPLWLKGAP